MIYVLFCMGFCMYSFSAVWAYSLQGASITGIVVPAAVFGALTNILWYIIAYSAANDEQRVSYGLWWDSMIILCYTITPVVFFNIPLGYEKIFGIVLVIAGCLLLR